MDNNSNDTNSSSSSNSSSPFWDSVKPGTRFVGTISLGRMKVEESNTTKRSLSFSTSLSIVKLVFLILFAISLFVAVSNGTPKTFESFIDKLSTIQLIPISEAATWFSRLTIVADWGLLNFLKDIINIITGAVSLVAFLGMAIVNFVPIILGFISWAFA